MDELQHRVGRAARKIADFCEEYTDEQQLDRPNAEEVRKQATFESIDYHKPYPTMYLRHLRNAYRNGERGRSGSNDATTSSDLEEGVRRPVVRSSDTRDDDGQFTAYDASSRNSTVRWLLHIVIGVAVGVVATCISGSLTYLEEWRTATLVEVVSSTSNRHLGYFLGFLFWLGSAAVFIFASTLTVHYIEPAAGGSGLPDVIAYLNGILLAKVLNVKTFIAKAISCVLSVSGGLPVGTEAPLIHLGAITGFGVTQGRSRTMGCQTNLFQSYRNHKDRRDFVTAGAACGVAAAFGAPIGGLLFVMEEVASFWDHSASGQIFLASMVSFCTVAFINTFTESGSSGFVSNKAAILFEVNYSIPLNITAVIPAVFLGLLCGLLATGFTKLNLRVVRFRRRHFKPFVRRKLLEPTAIALVFATVCYLLALGGECQPTLQAQPVNHTTGLQPWQTENITRLVNFTCSQPGYYSPLATLTLTVGKGNIRHFFTRRTADEFPASVIFVYFVVYFFSALYTSGTFVSSGLVIPMLVIGSTVGRLFGVGLVNLFALHNVDGQSAYYVDHSWMDPGVFAVIGAGAFFGGVSRMAMSLSVIMVELSGELHYLLPVMVAITVAKATADYLTQPLYHALLHLDWVPYLPHDVPVDVEQFTAEDVMCSSVVSFGLHEQTATVVHALQSCTHHAFPVVARERRADGVMRSKFVGLVTREDIQLMLSLPQLIAPPDEEERRAEAAAIAALEQNREPPVSKRSAAVSKMTWVEWMNHQTSLFFVIGSTRWHEKWARTNAPVTLPTRPAGGGSPGFSEAAARHLADASARLRSSGGGIDLNELFPPGAGQPPPPPAGEPGQAVAAAAAPPSRIQHAGSTVVTGSASADAQMQLDLERLPKIIDLSLIVNRSPWVVPPFFNLSQTYTLFRQMGLRHLVVVDGEKVVGIITRKDLLLPRLKALLRRGPSEIYDVGVGGSDFLAGGMVAQQPSAGGFGPRGGSPLSSHGSGQPSPTLSAAASSSASHHHHQLQQLTARTRSDSGSGKR